MIVTGGFNVFPREVEDVVAEHPAVAQVCVIGTRLDGIVAGFLSQGELPLDEVVLGPEIRGQLRSGDDEVSVLASGAVWGADQPIQYPVVAVKEVQLVPEEGTGSFDLGEPVSSQLGDGVVDHGGVPL
jgi:acyl-CoA synthetase (AMP-forming)/AMP-acid ligase II